MQVKKILLLMAPCILAGIALGQTALEINKKYGKPVRSYSVSERIWMTLTYGLDGNVCEMRLYPKRIDSKTNYLGSRLDDSELNLVLDNLAPPETRGNRSLYGLSLFGGGICTTLFLFENVGFTFVSSINFRTKNNDSEIDIDLGGNSKKYVPAEIVTVRWKNRKCSKDK